MTLQMMLTEDRCLKDRILCTDTHRVNIFLAHYIQKYICVCVR